MTHQPRPELTARERSGALIGLVVVFGTLLYVVLLSDRQLTVGRMWAGVGLKWLQTVLLFLLVISWERGGLRSIGLRRPGWLDIVLIPVIFGIFRLLTVGVAAPLVRALGTKPNGEILTFLRALPAFHKASIVLTAAFTEEVMFRGYAIEAVQKLTGRTWLAVVLTTALFMGAHLPDYGIAMGVTQTLETLVLALVYVWRRNLVAPIGAHLVVDALGVFG